MHELVIVGVRVRVRIRVRVDVSMKVSIRSVYRLSGWYRQLGVRVGVG